MHCDQAGKRNRQRRRGRVLEQRSMGASSSRAEAAAHTAEATATQTATRAASLLGHQISNVENLVQHPPVEPCECPATQAHPQSRKI